MDWIRFRIHLFCGFCSLDFFKSEQAGLESNSGYIRMEGGRRRGRLSDLSATPLTVFWHQNPVSTGKSWAFAIMPRVLRTVGGNTNTTTRASFRRVRESPTIPCGSIISSKMERQDSEKGSEMETSERKVQKKDRSRKRSTLRIRPFWQPLKLGLLSEGPRWLQPPR